MEAVHDPHLSNFLDLHSSRFLVHEFPPNRHALAYLCYYIDDPGPDWIVAENLPTRADHLRVLHCEQAGPLFNIQPLAKAVYNDMENVPRGLSLDLRYSSSLALADSERPPGCDGVSSPRCLTMWRFEGAEGTE